MSDTLEWLNKVKASKKSTVSFEAEGETDGDFFEGKNTSIVPNLPKRTSKFYTGKDLHGLKVAHNFDSFEAGHSEILVLEDTGVLEADKSGDLLVSAALKEEERIKRHREITRHAKGYSGFKAFEEDPVDDSIILGGGSRKSNILQKYDYGENFSEEPDAENGFILGEALKSEPARPSSTALKASSVLTQMDTVQSYGVEMIDLLKRKSLNKSDLERERKKAKKLNKSLFADEPEMQADRAEALESNLVVEDDDEELDLQRIIASSRREKLSSNPLVVEPALEPITLKGKSFDVIFSESISAPATRGEDYEGSAVAPDVKMDVESHQVDFDTQCKAEEVFSPPILTEPLVRSGVAATLALLNMRGISLKPRVYDEKFKSENNIGTDIKLEYYDDFGNKLTSKEAYKELSRRFHGKKAGKSRIEKAIMKRQLTDRIEKANASKSVIVENLRKQQEQAGAPYVVLSSTRTQEAVPAPSATATAEPVKQRKIFGLQVKK